MEKKDIIELTKKVYKLTLLFPKKEPLRYKVREIADEFLADFIRLPNSGNRDKIFSLKTELELIDSYFEVAKWQNWVSYFDILEVQEEYAKMRDNLLTDVDKTEIQENLDFGFFIDREKIPGLVEESIIRKEIRERNKNGDKLNLNSRKGKILKILEKVGRIQVGEINKLFPDVSKRTIRRDFHKLVEQGLVERIGNKNETFYKPKTQNIQVGQ